MSEDDTLEVYHPTGKQLHKDRENLKKKKTKNYPRNPTF